LLEPAVKAFLGFFAQVPDEVRGNNRLDVGCKPATSGTEVKRFIGKIHFNAAVYEFSKIRPIPEISCRAVNLVDDYACGFASFQEFEHFGKDRSATFGSGF
jgi:hypothetical protein